MEKSSTPEHFIGVDFHKETTVVTRLRKDGSRAGKTQTFASTREGLTNFRDSCTPQDHVVVEATYHWALFADVFEEFEGELVLAHPSANRLIAESRNKNDKVDSKVLADLLRTDFLARAWIAPREVRDARELLRYRCSLVRIQSALKNRVRVMLAKAGRSVEASDIFGVGAMIELEKMDLGATRNGMIKGYLELARKLSEVIGESETEIKERVKKSPEAERVDSIRGFGSLAALTVVSEIGEITRFSRAAKRVSYAGLAPTNRQSAGVLRHGPITKQGSPWLRWILIEATQHAVSGYPQLAELHRRVTANQGGRKNAGRIAVARQLLVSIYHMLKHKQAFNPERIGGRKKREQS
jgi:transposase